MTSRQFLELAVKRWYVLLAGILLTGGVAAAMLAFMPVVYYARTTVTVMRYEPNPLRADGSTISGMAVILATRANEGKEEYATSSPETTLYGEGILDGSRVRTWDAGGQWVSYVPEPVLIVEATGPNPDQVIERTDQILEGLSSDLEHLQRELGASVSSWMYLRVSPDRTTVEPMTGNRRRFLGSVVVVGLVSSALALRVADRALTRVARQRVDRDATRHSEEEE